MACPRRSGAGTRQLIASICSCVRLPGTIVTGMRSFDMPLVAKKLISGPGPSGPVPAARTRMEIDGSLATEVRVGLTWSFGAW